MKPLPSRLEALPLDGGQAELLVAREPDARFAVHWHAEWSVGAIETGHCDFTCDGERRHAGAGDVVVMPPGAIHTAGVSVQGFEMRMLYLPPDWVRAAMAWPADRQPGQVQTALNAPALAQALCDAADRRDGAALGALAVQALQQACTAPLAARGDGAGLRAPRDPRVRQLCDELAQLDAASLDLAALAQRIGVSREHLHRLFREAVGLSPREYSRCARIHQAKQKLGRGEPIADTAQACGFADQAHFSRWFKRVFGVTPAGYRPHAPQRR
jgi:AraC-like DNA-binding protein/quercetin dioxygenase-like cupin family protein